MSDNPPLITQGELYKLFESDKEFTPGENAYVISLQWLKKFKNDTGINRPNPQQMSTCGPIDNKPLLIRNNFIAKEKEGQYEIISKDMWDMLHNWYQGGPEITLKVVESSTGPKVILSDLKLKCYYKFTNPKDITTNKYVKIKNLREEVMKMFNVGVDKETRLWDYYQKEYKNEMKDENELSKYNLIDDQEIYLDIKENGKWFKDDQIDSTLDMMQATIDPQKMNIQFNNQFPNNNIPNFNNQPDSIPNYNNNFNNFNDNLPYVPPESSSFPSNLINEKPVAPGVVGLQNIGNTCFFNAGVQCLLHNVTLMNLILKSTAWDDEINPNHMNGPHGELAKAFSKLMKSVWTGDSRVIIPNNLKMVIGQYAPQFNNTDQQDSHEFLVSLLTGLHEDLNRKSNRNPSHQSISGNGENDHEVAREAWEAYKSKNDSIITDNFCGLFRSELRCPECGSVTTVFDPYNIISLPMSTHNHGLKVTFIPLNYNEPYQKMHIEIPANLTFPEISKIVSEEIKREVKVIIGGYRILDDIEWGINDYSETSQPHLCAFEVTDYDSYLFPCLIEMKEKNENSTYSYGSNAINFEKLIGKPFVLSFDHSNPTEMEIAICAREHLSCLWAPYKGDTPSEYIQDIIRQGKYFAESIDQSSEFSDMPIAAKLPKNYDGTFGFKYDQKYPKFERAIVKLFFNPLFMDNDEQFNNMNPVGNPQNYLNTDAKFSYKALFCHLKRKKEKSVDYNSPQMTLEDCFSIFTQQETLDSNNKWHCPNCNNDVCADKKMDLWSVPDSLIINLKRFGAQNSKLETFVGYDVELDLTDFIIGGQADDQQVMYRLYGVTEHMGGVGQGHYTAHVRVVQPGHVNGEWYYFNDSEVSVADEKSAVNRSAYVLFYQRMTADEQSESETEQSETEQFNEE